MYNRSVVFIGIFIVGMLAISFKLATPDIDAPITQATTTPVAVTPKPVETKHVDMVAAPEPVYVPKKVKFTADSRPEQAAPYKTTYEEFIYTNYGMVQDSVNLPTHYYEINGDTFTVEYTFDGDNKYGHLQFNVEVKNISVKPALILANFAATSDVRPRGVYIQEDDILFVWDSYHRSGCCSNLHRKGFIVFNSTTKKVDSQRLEDDDESGLKSLNESLYFAIKDGSLYAVYTANSGDQKLYLIKDGTINEVL